MLLHHLGVEVLRGQIRRIVCSRNFFETELLTLHLVLHPEIAYVQVSELAQTCSAHYSNCCACVSVCRDTDAHAEVAHQGHHPEALGRAFG